MSLCSARASSGERPHRGELHRRRDRGRADVERAAKNERKAQDVVDLIGVVGASGAR